MKQNLKKWLMLSITLFVLAITKKTIAQTTYTVSTDAVNWSCGLDESMMNQLMSDTGFVGRMARYNNFIDNPPGGNQPQSGAPYIVPVVFHVILPVGTPSTTITYNQIKWQVARFNAGFLNQMNLFNGQSLGTRAVNTQIEFRLACVAQNCGAGFTNTNEPGLMRYYTNTSNVLNQGVLTASTYTPMLAITHPTTCPTTFPFANYLNIWCVPTIGGGNVIGYGTFPWLGAGIDGVVMDIDAVGNNSYQTNFPLIGQLDKGAVLTHELGHYLGLYHTFETMPNAGSPAACFGTTTGNATTDGDKVLDTPPTFINADLGSITQVNSCHETNFPYGGGNPMDVNDQLENYMSYSDDDKLNTFTQGQAARMQSAFTNTYTNRINLNSVSNFTATGIVPQTCSLTAGILTGIFNYSIAPASNCNTVNIQFTNPLSVGFNTVGTTYSWNFGNGTGTGPNPLHTYYSSGGYFYAVTCTATNGTATATFTQNISINLSASIAGQSGLNMEVCRGTEQTIFINVGGGVPFVTLTDGTNQINVQNNGAWNGAQFPYTFVANSSASYSVYPVGCGSGVATFSVVDCCNNKIVNGDFSSGSTGFNTQLVNMVNTNPTYYGTYTIVPVSTCGLIGALNGMGNQTGDAMLIDGFSGQPPTLSYSIVPGCTATTIPSSVTPLPIVWQQTVTALQPSQKYYFSFKVSENFNNHSSYSCDVNWQTKIYNATNTLVPTQTLSPIYYQGGTNPNAHLDYVVYTYSFVTSNTITPAMTFSVEIDQIKSFYGTYFDMVLDNITLNQMTPSIQAIGTNTICPAQTTTLNAVASCNTSTVNFNYVWSPNYALSSNTIINPVANPTTTTVYTLVATPTATGIPASITTVTITVRPTFTIVPTNTIVYLGQCATLTVSGSTGTYTWNPGSITGNSISVCPSSTTVYTVTNAASGTCTANNTSTVIVSTACSQSITASFSGVNFPASTTAYTVANTVYEMNGVITFTGNTTFTGYTLRMRPGTKLKVNGGVTLTFNNCKLFGCTELWYGIELNTADGNNANINVQSGTTIEDMYYGIYREIPYATGTASQGYINITNSKLNKNYYGVQLINVKEPTPSGATYSLTVKNSTLTTASSTTSPGSSLKPSTISTYTYAYNQIAGGAGGGTAAYTNFPRSYTAINLVSLSPNSNVVIGDSAGAANTYNTFSNLDFGIWATNSNLRVHNNYFYNMKGSQKYTGTGDIFNPPPTVNGPDEIGIAVISTPTVANTFSLQVGTKSTTPVTLTQPYPKSNSFKMLYKGIHAKNCSVVIAKGNYFDSDTTDVPATDYQTPDNSWNTYYYWKSQNAIVSTGLGKGSTLNNNFIKNYRSAIISAITLSTTTGSYLTVKSNNIQVPNNTGYCRYAIKLDQVGGANMPANAIEVATNSINKVYMGISAASFSTGIYIHDNTNLTLDNVKTLGKGINPNLYTHYGIFLSSVTNGRVEKNNITSTGTITASNYTCTNGFYNTASPSNTITCNSANNMGRGYYFQANCQSNNGWMGNAVSNSYNGLELKSSGVIGIQGVAGGTLAANTWSNVTQETYVTGTSNANTASRMIVPANGTYTTAPSLNFGTSGQIYVVGLLQGIDIQSGTPFDCGGGGCGGCLMGGSSANSLSSSSSSSSNDTYFSQMAATTNTDYPQYADEMIFQNQQLVYRLQKQGSLSTTSTNQLNSFYTANQNSNIGKFYDVQTALANNQKSMAQSKNSSIIPSNVVQQKTQRTYELLLKTNMNSNYKYSSSEIQDLTNMANECPVKGWYVSQSRSILNAINGNIVEYTNECGEIKSGSRMASEENIASIKVIPTMFNLYPNPNNGFMTMYYDLGNDKDADMNLYDVTGKLINSYKLENSVGTIEINEADLHNGIYFYRILVNGNIINTNKVVIIK